MGGSLKKPTLSHRLQVLGIRGAVGALRFVNLQRAGSVGAFLGKLAYRPFGIRRAVVERQIRAAFPGLDEPDVQRIALASYAHLGRISIEAALVPGYKHEMVAELFERVEGWDCFANSMNDMSGAMIVTGHLGNWELGGAYIGLRGSRMHAVARGMENPLFDEFITENRERLNVRVIHDSDAVRKVPRVVRQGGVVGFLFDQGAAGLASTWVPFFGRYAKTPRGPAVFALRLKAPLVFAVAIRQPAGRYVLHMENVPITDTGNVEADVDAIVAEYTRILERWVRKYPEQYFWQHRRWKHQRPGTPPELGDPS
ncbi:MAG: lipid biosynthesis acyltransferase [Gemmatimonadetes bacterium]|nr:lipid biosynthesis acyltransferase [Gemmatimonadota bacterium]